MPRELDPNFVLQKLVHQQAQGTLRIGTEARPHVPVIPEIFTGIRKFKRSIFFEG